ncbi:hypothetical protein BH10PLA2_BH10PLA2_19220 [soil metagenome]
MQRTKRLWAGLCAPALATAMIAGCSGDKAASSSGGKPPVTTGGGTGKGSAASGGEKIAVEAKDTATIKGKISFDGTPPAGKDIKAEMNKHADHDLCLAGDTSDQTWIVGADKGVANVVVWVKAPEGKYLATPAAKQAQTKKVTMDQPFCAFVPHVVAFDPTFYDAVSKKQKKTGEIFEVLNSSSKNHNTTWSGDKLINSGGNEIIKSKGAAYVVDAVPSKADAAGKEDLINISCDIHKWMTGKAAVFDHPFYAVTDKNGNFEIKDVPAGSELVLCYWHESMDPNSLKGAKKENITLKAGETSVKEFKVK